ncbi:MAG TPA: nuclear transport factor 2 family protein [Microthrixaceae bacterium]|nr:nuclear transport factor 2 family protein [Microthrixaceae bacterium]
MNTTTTPDPDRLATTVRNYFASWNETDPQRRLELCEAVWTAHGHYLDPFADAHGVAEIDAYLAGMQTQFPDHRVERTTSLDEHHGVVRFGWAGFAPDGTVAFEGIDVVTVDAEGRFGDLRGFLGDLAPLDLSAA